MKFRDEEGVLIIMFGGLQHILCLYYPTLCWSAACPSSRFLSYVVHFRGFYFLLSLALSLTFKFEPRCPLATIIFAIDSMPDFDVWKVEHSEQQWWVSHWEYDPAGAKPQRGAPMAEGYSMAKTPNSIDLAEIRFGHLSVLQYWKMASHF